MTTAAWQGFGFSSEMARRNFLAYVILTTCLVSGQSPRYVLKGQKVTLKKDITARPDNILWTHDGNKVVECNGGEERVYDPYKTRVTLDWSSAELHINDLRLEDSGKYELEVFVNQNLEKSYHEVEILDRVAKPTVFCNINNIDNSGTLVCSAEPRQPVHLMTFEWHSQGSVHPGPHLQISLGDEHDDKVYSCVVRNPLTTETAAFTAKDCYTTKSSSLALIVAVIVISLLLLIGVPGILCYCRKKQKGSGGTVETDEATPFVGGRSADKVDRDAAEAEQLSKSADKETQQDELNSPTVVSPGAVGDLLKFFEGKQNTGQTKDDINNKNTPAEDHLSEGSDKQEGHASNAESANVHQDTSSEQKFSTTPASPADKVDRDAAEAEQLSESADKETQQDELNSPTVVSPGAVGDLLKFFEEKKNTGQTKDDINNKNTPVEDHLSEGSDKQEGHASNAESANVHQDTSSEQKSSTTPASPVLDPSKTDKSDSDPEQSSKVSLEKATDPAAAGPDTGPVSEPECAATGKKIPPSGINVQQLSEPADEEKQQGAGDPERSGEPADSSEDVGFEVNCPTDIARGLVKERSKKFQKANLNNNENNNHQPSDRSSDQKDLDEQQLNEPSEKWKQEDAGDPEPEDESAERSENVLPEPKSPTAADGSGL